MDQDINPNLTFRDKHNLFTSSLKRNEADKQFINTKSTKRNDANDPYDEDPDVAKNLFKTNLTNNRKLDSAQTVVT